MISLDVRFASDSDRNADIAEGPQCAMFGHAEELVLVLYRGAV
jgi:hypothetical protein